ncbi:MAG: sensor histidine kinase [Phenylobacterium sp.]
MNRVWSAIFTPRLDATHPVRGFFLGQILALATAVTGLAAHLALGSSAAHSVYLFCVPAVLVAAGLGGPAAGVTATLILAAGAFAGDGAAGLAVPERALRVGLFLLVGVAVSAASALSRTAWAALHLRAAQQAEREALLRASLDRAADATIAIDHEGRILTFSHAAEQLFGWKAEEVVGRNVRMLMPPSYAQAHDAYIDRYLATGDSRVIGAERQVAGLRKDGAEFPMDLKIHEVKVGAKRFFTGVVHDLSTLREAERRSDELRAQLTQVWSLNSMGEMASVLAHELNQPLSAVANYLRAARTLIAKLELDEDDLVDAVSRAGDQAVRAGEIIRTMRDLAARGGAERKPESLSGILGEIEFIIGLMVRDAGARVFYDLYRGPDIVLADRIQIQQLVVNLVRNAIDAVAKFPNREIRISTKINEDGKFVTTVEDSVPGVDPNVMGRVFQPLSSTKPDGMGLGLSICSAIVENHGGRIWVECSPLGGAAFSFVLARASVDRDAVPRTDRVRRR